MEQEEHDNLTVESAGRLDKVLAALVPEQSRSRLKVLIQQGQISVNGETCDDPSAKVSAGDEIALVIPEAEEAIPQPENIPLDVVYEDDDLLVINKAAGMVVHPGAGNQTGTLVGALLYHCGDTLSGIGGVKRPGIVHRLDKDTSGLMVVAKNDRAHHGLAAQLSERSLSRVYYALVWKEPVPLKGTINTAIGRHQTNRLKMAVRSRASGREAITHYFRQKSFGGGMASFVTCELETGRTHQIRVHMAAIRHPCVGDMAYGADPTLADRLGLRRQWLHAVRLGFEHPTKGEWVEFESPYPDDLARALEIVAAES
jgi:23S rRNA pseudouridine1911/1915/1917 synthase